MSGKNNFRRQRCNTNPGLKGIGNSMETPTLTVDLIAYNDKGQILLGKVTEKWRDSGKYLWGLPGREVELGETIIQAAKRSLYEETELRSDYVEIKHINTNFGFDGHYVAVGVLMRVHDEPTITLPEDWEEWRWFSPSDIPEPLFPSANVTLKAYKMQAISIDC